MILFMYVVYCYPLTDIDNGNITCDTLGDDGVYSYEDTCNVTCNSRYLLIGSDTRMCLSDGSWSGMDSSCQGEIYVIAKCIRTYIIAI